LPKKQARVLVRWSAAGDPDAEARHNLVMEDDVLWLLLTFFRMANGSVRPHAVDPRRNARPQ